MKQLFFGVNVWRELTGIPMCQETATIGWNDWNARHILRGIDCLQMEIPYTRIAVDLAQERDYKLFFVMADPWENLRKILIDWYRRGAAKESFAFYREFHIKVNEFGLESAVALRMLDTWLSEQNPHPLFNPQLAMIDPSRDPERVREILSEDFDRIVSVRLTDEGTRTPLHGIGPDALPRTGELIRGETKFYAALQRGEILLKHGTTKEKERPPKVACRERFVRGSIKSVSRNRIKGTILFRAGAPVSLELLVRVNGTEVLRCPLPVEEKPDARGDSVLRIPFRLSGLTLTPHDRVSVQLLPCKRKLRYSEESRAFFSKGIRDRYAASIEE